MLKENYDLQGALQEYMSLLDREEYFDAHEVMEEAWHPLRKSKDPLRNLAKGLINGAIAFEHIKRDRHNAAALARRVIAAFDRYKHLSTDQIKYAALFKQSSQMIENLKSKHSEVFDVLVP